MHLKRHIFTIHWIMESRMSVMRKLDRLTTPAIDKALYATSIKNAGLTVTLSRLHVLSAFYLSGYPRLSAVDVYKYLAKHNISVSLSTVYNVLNDFTQTGLLLANSFESSGKVFELNKGSNTGVLICPVCNKSSEFPGLELGDAYKEQIKNSGFSFQRYAFSITCMCLDCSDTSKRK